MQLIYVGLLTAFVFKGAPLIAADRYHPRLLSEWRRTAIIPIDSPAYIKVANHTVEWWSRLIAKAARSLRRFFSAQAAAPSLEVICIFGVRHRGTQSPQWRRWKSTRGRGHTESGREEVLLELAAMVRVARRAEIRMEA